MKKKILALALAAVMVFSFAACSDEDKNPVDIKMSKYMTVEQLDNFEVEATLYELTDEDVEAATRDLFNAMSEPVGIIDRAVENGDWVNIDFVGYKDEVAFDGGSSQGELLEIGSGTFIDGFEDGLIGVTPGQPVDLNLKFPENYTNADLAGQDVVFNVTVNFIVPEINDTTVAGLEQPEYSNAAEMKAYVKTTLQEELDESNKNRVITLAKNKIMNATEYKEVPEFLVTQQTEIITNKHADIIAQYGVSIDEFFQVVYQSTVAETANNNVKERMLIIYMAQELDIVVSDEELETELTNMAAENAITADELLVQYNNDKEYFREYLLAMKIYDYIYENTTVTAPAETPAN